MPIQAAKEKFGVSFLLISKLLKALDCHLYNTIWKPLQVSKLKKKTKSMN